jgi:hypothetical protein
MLFLVVVKAVTANVESLQVISTFLSGAPSFKAAQPSQGATAGTAPDSEIRHRN